MDRSWNRLFVWIFGILGLMVYLPVAGSGQSGPQSGLIPGRNINMVSGTTLPGGDPYLQRQNEGSVAHSTRNPMHLMGGANDYRTIDIPGLPADQETGDAWLGLFKSFDGGQSWQSTLLPGYPQDTSPAGLSSPLRGFKAAADPTVRAGAHGMFFYSGIVFDRSLNSSAVFVARFIDLNNREGVSFDVSNNRDPIKYLDVKVIESGTSGQFLDKTWLAVDIPRPGARTISLNVPDSDAPGGSVQQSGLACGNVYVAYANFTGETKKNVRTKVMVARSLDCGTTWEKPIMVDESWHISQGTTLAIDPSNGDVYVAWRQFQTSSNADGIVVAKSTDGGRRFSKAVPVALIPFPADQPTLPQTGLEDYRAFRTSAFPTMAVDSQSRIYVAWSQRDGSTGLGRVYMATSTDGAVWSTPLQIEPGVTGGQFMPALVFGGGKLTLLYYDLRHDLNPIYPGGLITDVRPSDDQLWHPPMLPLGRHTVDVRAAQFEPGQSPPFSSVRVSQYYSIIRDLDANPVAGGPAKVPVWQPLQFNPPNYPLFALGTKPFMSDYVDLTASPGMMYRNGAWRFNVDEPVDLHGVWTDNRDVVPPAFPWDWTAYVPPGSGAPCSTAGMRNQNIYTARLTPGMVVGTMGNSKDLYPDKFSSFVVFVQNLTNGTKSYHLSVSQPAGGGEARFSTGNGSLDIGGILPHEGLVRTVLVRSSNRRASVTVTVTDTTPGSGGLARKVVLNPDPSNPPLLSVSNGFETHNPFFEKQPDGSAAQLFTWPPMLIVDSSGTRRLNPAYLSPEMLNPEMLNPEMLNPEMLNPEMLNPEMLNPEMLNPEMLNPEMLNPEMLNPEMLNPEMLNPEMLNPEMLNTSITDVTWVVGNGGNVDSGYRFAPLGQIPSGTRSQLFIYRTYKTPFCNGGFLDEEGANFEVLANLSNPQLIDPTDPNQFDPEALQYISDAVTYKAGRSEKIYVKLRVWNPGYRFDDYDPGQPWDTAANPLGISAGAVVVAQAGNTDGGMVAWASTPIVTRQPSAGAVCAGDTVVLEAAAAGNPEPLIQWQVSANGGASWADIQGETGPTLTFMAMQGMSGYRYRARFSNENGRTDSIAATLTVNDPVAIVAPPQSREVCLGASVTFAVGATGTAMPGDTSLRYQWRKDGVNIVGATAASYAIPSVTESDAGSYDVTVTGACGSQVSPATGLTVNTPPAIISHPVGQKVVAGATANFTAQAEGRPAPTVQWQVSTDGGSSWTDIPGAVSSSLTLEAGAGMNGYRYRAVFSNSCGTVTTTAAALTVHYDFIGFGSPLGPAGNPAPPTVYGPFNQQSNVTVKWQVKDAGGNFIGDLSVVTSLRAEDGPGGTVILYQPDQNTTGSTVLRYGSEQFIFNWDVTQTPAGLYTLVLELNDGSQWKVKVRMQ